MDLHTTEAEGGVVLAPAGRLDMASAASFRLAVERVLADGHRHVVIDFSSTEFLDSSGLGAVVAGLKAARALGGDLRIASPNDQVWTVFSLTTLDRVFRAYPSVHEALHEHR